MTSINLIVLRVDFIILKEFIFICKEGVRLKKITSDDEVHDGFLLNIIYYMQIT